ncbi:hypothetical protein ACX5I6_20805 [Arthrobacter sp. MMS24-T111]
MLAFEPIDSGDPALSLMKVETGAFRAIFLPSVGGRLLSLRVDGNELLWVNPRIFDRSFRALQPRSAWPVCDGTFKSWTNVGGSKTWPAPQGWGGDHQWPGPPDDVLDAGSWSLTTKRDLDSLVVTMVSPHDLRTGLCITREFTFTAGSSGFHERIRFLNVSGRVVEWSLWEVAQTDTSTGGVVDVSVSTHAEPVDLGQYAGSADITFQDNTARMLISPGVAKFGFPNATGRVAWTGPTGEKLQLSVDVHDGATYPDGGSRVEVWTQSPLREPLPSLDGFHPDAWLVELEVLSPLYKLAPGESADFEITWDTASGGQPGGC